MLGNQMFAFLSVTLLLLLRQALLVSSQACPNNCNAKGRCMDPGNYCKCFKGFMGPDCSLRSCPYGNAWVDIANGTDIAHAPAECSNAGICVRTTGVCNCRQGFEGNACQRKSCPNSCFNYGKCQSMQYYATRKDPGLGTVYTYTNVWDAYKMQGCNCDPKFHGPDCSLRNCSRGDDPLTGVGVSTASNPNQVNEIQKITCKAGGGTFTITFRKKTSAQIPYDANAAQLQAYIEEIPTIGAGNIKLIMYSTQACKDSGVSWTVEFTGNFGSLPLLVGDISKLTFSDPKLKSYIDVVKQVDGTKEDLACSGRGICDTTSGVCVCSTGYATSDGYNKPGTRGDCGYTTQVIQVCPGVLSCSGHGQCRGNPTYACICQAGWTGADCSLRTCPEGPSWFTYPNNNDQAHLFESSECSDMGTCDRTTGLCTCIDGYSGSACQYMTCPGLPRCSGRGECLSMSQLAGFSANYIGEPYNYSYGLTPNNPSTWDAERILGCVCDDGFTGYDCSLRTCPYGDDPVTVHFTDDEVQLITCSDTTPTTGSVKFSFRFKAGLPLPPSATMAMLKSNLQGIKGVGEVLVERVNASKPDSLCIPGGSQIRVTFLTSHGDLPLLRPIAVGVNSTAVTELVRGNKEWLECSGRGICDRTVGVCDCFNGYGSSDGKGHAGKKADCGYILNVLS